MLGSEESTLDLELETLRHSLGLSISSKAFRNHYATDPGHPKLEALVSKGLMVKGRQIPGGLMYYHSTEAGIALAMAHQPKITAAGARSKERYKKFLFLRDIMPNLSFREFVCRRYYNESWL
jgi:hypothetical protein